MNIDDLFFDKHIMFHIDCNTKLMQLVCEFSFADKDQPR